MRWNELQIAMRKQPFEPFRIQLSNGDSYVVRHPEFAALSRTSLVVGVPSKKDGVPDRFVQMDLLHVVSIEPINGGRSGTKRKPRKK